MGWIHNNILLPLAEPDRHRGLGTRLRALERFDAMPPAAQAAVQQSKVRAVLEHAYRNTPYYRALFDQLGFRADDWQPEEPLPVPVLTRELLRAHGEELCSRAYPKEALRRAHSGGTSSTPVTLWRDLEGLRNRTALQLHLNRQAGYDQGDPVLHIWGAIRDIELHPSWRWRLYEQGLLRRSVCSAAELSPPIMDSLLDELNQRKPKILYGYSATTARFAEYLQKAGAAYHRPQRLIVTAEPLSSADRQLLQETFDCPVTEHYGSRDVGIVAAECDHGRLHFHPWSCLIELVPIATTESGSLSRLLITDLTNLGMPLIRYDTGDCVVSDGARCGCGSRFPSVNTIMGRALDNFLLSDGTVVPGLTLSTRLAGLRFCAVQQVQLIQKSFEHIHLRYAAEGDAATIDQDLTGLRAEMERALGIAVHWTSDRVPEVARERSGKYRLTISEVVGKASGERLSGL